MTTNNVNVIANLALIGMRGTGKTAVGQSLAARLHGTFFDLDLLVSQAAGMTIAEIFGSEGEAGFRRRESEALRSMLGAAVPRLPAIYSLGGGAVIDASNRQAIREAATVVWLTAPVSVLEQRVARDEESKHNRPSLLTGGGTSEMAQVMQARESIYRDACDFAVDTAALDVEAVAARIIQRVANT